MKIKTLTFLIVVLLLCAWATETRAQLSRTFVSANGNDANNCSLRAPCRNFATAIANTAANGEITALDSATYDAGITIDKSLTIQSAPGALAILGGSTTTVLITAPATAQVVLRNLFISRGQTGGTRLSKGIQVNSVGALHLENCVVTGFTNYGISFSAGLNDDGSFAKLFVKDAIVRNNNIGILLSSSQVSIDHSRIENNRIGVNVETQVRGVTLNDCLIAGNSDYGLISNSVVSPGPTNLENCMVTNNGTGIYAGVTFSNAPNIVFVSHTMISGNVTGLSGGGHIRSFGNNRLANNGTNGAFTHTLQEQ